MKDITTTLFKVPSPKAELSCGGMLVSQPFMKEAYFNHGVVALIDYLPDEGATGVVMNNRTEFALSDLLEGIKTENIVPVFCGGPLGQDRIFFIHSLGEIIPGARQFAPGLYVGGDFEAIKNYVNSGYPTEGFVRFFVGYSSWTAGQLEREIKEESWVLANTPQSPEAILTESGDRYWHRTVESLGETYRPWRLIPSFPEYN